MKFEHETGVYPPRVEITACRKDSPLDITISVSNVQGADLSMQTTLPCMLLYIMLL